MDNKFYGFNLLVCSRISQREKKGEDRRSNIYINLCVCVLVRIGNC